MDEVLLVVRPVLALAAVLVVLWLLKRRFIKAGLKGQPQPITIVSRQGLSQKAAVVVMDTGGKRYVLGVTESSVSVLDSEAAPEPEPVSETAQAPAKTWSEVTKGSILSPATWSQAKAALPEVKAALSKAKT